MKRLALAAAVLLGAGCYDFDTDLTRFCTATGRCSDGGVGGGFAVGGGSAAMGGGSGGGSGGGVGGGAQGGGAQGGGVGGGAPGGGAGGGMGGGGGVACATELCHIQSWVIPDVMLSIWGPSANDVWVAGDDLYKFDGGGFGRVMNPSTYRLFAIHGTGPNDVWTGGFDSPDVYRWDGNMWRTRGIDAGATAVGIYAANPGEAYLVGEAYLYQWGGARWDKVFEEDGGNYFQDVTGTMGAPNYAVAGPYAWRFENGQYDKEDLNTNATNLNAVSVGPEASVWVVGEYGMVARKPSPLAGGDGGWEVLTIDVPGLGSVWLYDVWAKNGNEAWMVGDKGAILRWRSDAGWTSHGARAIEDAGSNPTGIWFSVFGIGNEMWVGGGRHFLGSANFDAGAVSHFRLGP